MSKDPKYPPVPVITHAKPPQAVHALSRANRTGARYKNMYMLESGPHKGKMMGANQLNYHDSGGTDQRYIATEAPYDAADYYRMVLATDARTLVSLTHHRDSTSERAKKPLDLHHIAVGKQITFDGTGLFGRKNPKTVTCIEEKLYHAPYADMRPLRVKTYEVNIPGKHPFKLKHIFYDHWVDHGYPEKAEAVAIVAAINNAQAKFGEAGKRHPIVVNCAMGIGRSNTLILKHQIERVLQERIREHIPEGIHSVQGLTALVLMAEQLDKLPYKVDVLSLVAASERRVAHFKPEQWQMLKDFPHLFMKKEIEKTALELGLDSKALGPLQGPHIDAHKAGKKGRPAER